MDNCCCMIFSELRRKEVINVCTGCRIGFVCDIEFDCKCGKILALIVPERQSLFCFKKQCDLRVPWDCIDKISDDIILVTNAYPIREEK